MVKTRQTGWLDEYTMQYLLSASNGYGSTQTRHTVPQDTLGAHTFLVIDCNLIRQHLTDNEQPHYSAKAVRHLSFLTHQ